MVTRGTDANNPSYTDGCRIITVSESGQAETVYGGSNPGSRTVLTTAVTAETDTNGGLRLTAKATDGSGAAVSRGSFTFAYSDQGTSHTEDVNMSGSSASCDFDRLSTHGVTVLTAKYHDPSDVDDALKLVFYYNPEGIDLSSMRFSGHGYTYDTDRDVDQGAITLTQNGWYVFTGNTTTNKIKVANGVSAWVTLDNASIDVSGGTNKCAFSLDPGAAVNLSLTGTNKLKSGGSCAGLHVPASTTSGVPDASLTITGQSTGSLDAVGGNGGAGIGGGNGEKCGAVQINGNVQVHAQGQGGGYDIGSGNGGTVGGTLSVVGTDLNNGPTVELQAAGINAVNPSGIAHQFTNCKIWGTGAKSVTNPDISGCYDASGKIRLSVVFSVAARNSGITGFGSPVTVTANVTRAGFGDVPTLSGQLLLLCDGHQFGNPVSLTNGTTSTVWTPSDRLPHQWTAQYNTAGSDAYVLHSEDVTPFSYSAGKVTPVITAPTASPIPSGSKLSVSNLTGGTATDASGTTIPGAFVWAQRDQVVTATGNYDAVFNPNDATDYNTASVSVPVTVTAPTPTPSLGNDNSSDTSTPTLPSGVMDAMSNVQADLSGAMMPAGVTSVTLSVTPEAANGTPTTPETQGSTPDPQAAAAFHLAISTPSLNIIGTPLLYNIRLLDQNGNPITAFSGKVTVKIPVPAGLHGAPHVFQYEENTDTLTDLGATVQDGFLVFFTEYLNDYVVAGVGDSVMLDTRSYQMPAGGSYQIGLKLTGSKATSVKVTSTNGKVAAAVRLRNGNVQVAGKGTGTAYIMIDVYDSKNHLLTHASVRIDVKTGIRPKGDSTRQIGVF